jgi:hypothetical protein
MFNGVIAQLPSGQRKECNQHCQKGPQAFESFCSQYHDSDYIDCMNAYNQEMRNGNFSFDSSDLKQGWKDHKKCIMTAAVLLIVILLLRRK